MKRVLVIAAHADDETIGCGGTMLKHKAAGDSVELMIMTDGVGARTNINATNKNQAVKREGALSEVCRQLVISKCHQYKFPDNRMDQVALLDVVQPIEELISTYHPDIIYTHHGGDLNIDHRVVHQAVMTACRPQPGSSVQRILTFEVNSSTEWATPSIGNVFQPNFFCDISIFIEQKKSMLMAYQDELRAYPHTRSIEGIMALSQVRGSQVGVGAAEAFMLMREIG